ncbi:MAG: Lrp/AsnC ligand binding domain-containing protein [Nitratireductor sp.]|nr:Lrp/AsnC ligand binding domain-containing protein [Nitratireductor sp.]
MTVHSPDRIDRNILRALQADGRMSITDLSAAVGLSKTPCAERVKRLEKSGHIAGYHAELGADRLGFSHIAFVQVTLERTTTDVLDRFNLASKRIPEIESCHMVAGGFDYLLKVRTRDMAHFRRVLGDAIGALPGVASTHTYPVMETVLDKKGLDPVLI